MRAWFVNVTYSAFLYSTGYSLVGKCFEQLPHIQTIYQTWERNELWPVNPAQYLMDRQNMALDYVRRNGKTQPKKTVFITMPTLITLALQIDGVESDSAIVKHFHQLQLQLDPRDAPSHWRTS